MRIPVSPDRRRKIAFEAPISSAIPRAEFSREAYLSILSEGEHARLPGLFHADDRELFILARGFLRRTLSHYLKESPSEIRFEYGPFGKPKLSRESPRLEFNLSHSASEILVAVSADREIGIDVERTVREWKRLDRRVFSECEISELEKLPEEIRRDAFFRGWTQKEAFLKAVGKGMGLPLKEFTFRLDPRERFALLRSRRRSDESRWEVVEISGLSEHAGALVFERRPERPRYRIFDETLRLKSA